MACKPYGARALLAAGAVLACALLGACGASPEASDSVSSAAPSPSAAQSASESVPAPPADAFTDAEALGDFSEGFAFARVTLPDGRRELAYITAEGEIAFLLPEGYNFGFEFHEGFAPIAQIPGMDDFHIRADDYFYGERLSGKNCRYNLVDTQGNLLYSGGPYRFIGAVSEGKTLTWSVEEGYAGTSQTLAYRDAQETIVWQADADALYGGIPQYLQTPWGSQYRDGIAFLYEKNGGYEYVYGYDGAGNLLQTFNGEKSGMLSSEYADCFIAYRDTGVKFLAGIYQRAANTYIPLETMDESSAFYDVYSALPSDCPVGTLASDFNAGYSISKKGAAWTDGFFILDSSGNVTVNREESVLSTVGFGMDGWWIAELQNDYYSLLGTDGELACEPVQSKPHHLGGGLFAWDNGAVTDAGGTEQFRMPEGHRPVNKAFGLERERFYPSDGLFCDDIAVVVQGNSESHFMGREGQLLQSSTDFRAYAAE